MEVCVIYLLMAEIYTVLCIPASDTFFFSVLCILEDP